MLEGALGPGAPEAVPRHFNGPEGALLCPHVHGNPRPARAGINETIYPAKESLPMKYPLWTAALLAAIAIGAEAQQIKPETQLKLRKSAYALMNFNFDALRQRLEGMRPRNKYQASRHA